MLLALLLAATPLTWAQMSGFTGPRIFTCVDSSGKRLTSDRVIPECSAREQRVLNADGSVKRVVRPVPTEAEYAEAEAREREAAAERVARQDAIRRDRSLMTRYPNEASHRRAREAALESVRMSVRTSESRVKLLMAERKPLVDEAQFYSGKTLPLKLKSQIDANDAALEAQRVLIQNQESEVARIEGYYDAELGRLRKLWAGAQPGSLGTAVSPMAAALAAVAPTPKDARR